MRWFVFGWLALAALVNVVDLCKPDAKLAASDAKTRSVTGLRVAKMLALGLQSLTLWWLWGLRLGV